MKITKSKITFTKEENDILIKARDILSEIADNIDRAVSVPYTVYDDDEINGACDIINDLLGIED